MWFTPALHQIRGVVTASEAATDVVTGRPTSVTQQGKCVECTVWSGSAVVKRVLVVAVSDLRAELKKRNLPVSGAKPQLIERLKPFSSSASSPSMTQTDSDSLLSGK